MNKSKIALKPYLDTIAGYCDGLSNEELKNIIISLAKDISTSGRVGFLEKAGTIKTLLRGYANERAVYSERFSIADSKGTSFYDEIIKGLKHNKETKPQAAEYLLWAEKIGKKRIEHIVSNKHRRAYARAAQVLGSLAEAYLAMGQKGEAQKILHEYYNEKYNRFSAFRKEVKAVVRDSDMLRNSGFLN